MKKLLITGASGFLGGRIAEYYKENYEICAPSHSEMDITKEENVTGLFKKFRPDYVIHCAAISDTGRCEREPELSYLINVEGSRNVALAAKQVGARCILCSSDQVYFGKNEGIPHREDEILLPGNVYGRHKLIAEELCLKENPDCVNLRLSWMYDVESKKETEHSDFMRTLLGNLKAGNQVSYPVYDVRGITDVWEVVKNMEKAFLLPGGVYNFGSPNEDTTYHTVRKLFFAAGIEETLLIRNETAFLENPRNLSMNQEKANRYGISFSSTLDALISTFQKLNCK